VDDDAREWSGDELIARARRITWRMSIMQLMSESRRRALRRRMPTVCLTSLVLALQPVPTMSVNEATPGPTAMQSVPAYEVRLCVTGRTSLARFQPSPWQ
jgi:hypothetical protein